MKYIITLMLLGGIGAFGDVAILNTFTSGELSPHLDARVDFEKYSSGCKTLENFMVLPYGGALKRPGTQFIGETKNGGVARLAPFSVGVDQTYIMEMGEGYIRFYRDGVQLLSTNGTPLEVETPYTTNDLFEVQLAQFADTIYMVHGNHPVQKLQRTSTTPTFTIAEVEWSWPPTLDENLTETTITPSATTGTVTLTSSEELFTSNHVGAAWVLRTTNGDNKRTVGATETSSSIKVEGDWNLRTGILEGNTDLVTIQVSEDGGNTWGDFRVYGYTGDVIRYDRSGTESESGILYRIVTVGINGDTYFTVEEPYINGWVTITDYISATQVTATVESALGSTDATEIWFEGAFSNERGYPRTVEFYENRLWFGGNDYLVNTLWASTTDGYEDFQTGTYDDSSLRLSINSDNIIEWLLGRTQLFVGTLGDEWFLSGGDSLTPVTPTSVLARRQTSFGSKDGMDALIASDSIMYLQRQGRKLRELEYSLEADAYKSTDVTLLAEHITRGGILQIAEQQQPEPIVWCVRGDGQLVGMTFNKIQNIYGWHRHTTDGSFESVAVIPTDGEDRVYVVVSRKNGRYIEWFRPVDWGDDDEDAWFVDSGLDWEGKSAVTVTNALVSRTQDYPDTITVIEAGIESLIGKYIYIESFPLSDFAYLHEDSGGFFVFLDEEWNLFSSEYEFYSYTDGEGYLPSKSDWSVWESAEHGSFPPAPVLEYSLPPGQVTLIADNDFADGDFFRLSGDGGLDFTGFGDGVFTATNCTSTNFMIAYKNGELAEVEGVLSEPIVVEEVKNTFTNVSHLAEQEVAIFADGGVVPSQTVSTNGVLVLDEYYNHVTAGLPYTARLSPMYIDIVSSSVISYGKYKNPYKVHFRVNNSGRFKYGSSEDALSRVSVRQPDLTAGTPVPFFSGDPTTKPIDSKAGTAPEFWVTSEEPLPLELLSLTIFTDIQEYE